MADRSDPLGYDADVDDDLQPDGRAASGVRLVSNAILHRCTTGNLPLVGADGDEVEFGEDVTTWIGEVTTQPLADAKGPRLALVIGRDTRTDPGSINVRVLIDQTASDYDLRIEIDCMTTTALPISMVLGVNDVTVDLLAQGK